MFDVATTIIAVVFVVTSCILVIQGKTLPDQLVQWTWIVIGAHFGVGGLKSIVGQTVTTITKGVAPSLIVQTPDLGPEHPPTKIMVAPATTTTAAEGQVANGH